MFLVTPPSIRVHQVEGDSEEGTPFSLKKKNPSSKVTHIILLTFYWHELVTWLCLYTNGCWEMYSLNGKITLNKTYYVLEGKYKFLCGQLTSLSHLLRECKLLTCSLNTFPTLNFIIHSLDSFANFSKKTILIFNLTKHAICHFEMRYADLHSDRYFYVISIRGKYSLAGRKKLVRMACL